MAACDFPEVAEDAPQEEIDAAEQAIFECFLDSGIANDALKEANKASAIAAEAATIVAGLDCCG